MKQKGFITLLLMAVLAAVVAMGASIWQSARQNTQIAVVVQEEVVARNIAEQCLSKGVAVAAAHFHGRGNASFDFDRLLDPNTGTTSDDFLFCNGAGACTTPARAFLPPTSTSTTNQYAFEMIEPDGDAAKGKPGACLIRFDDNNDDRLLGYEAQTGNTALPEGPAASGNVRNRDRDASIIITAIGIYPVDPAISTDTQRSAAYANARAHVTMRQYFSAVPAPSGFATGKITVKGTSELCGTGGLRAQEVVFAGSSCLCGDLLAQTANGSTTASGVVQCPLSSCPDATASNNGARPMLAGGVPLGNFDARSALDLRAPPDVMQVRLPAEEYPSLCINKGETLGEAPRQTFTVADTVSWWDAEAETWTWAPGSDTPAVGTDTNSAGARWNQMARWWVRNDGAVFLWDGRPPTNRQEVVANNTRCDGQGSPPNSTWPVSPQNDTAAKNAFCASGNMGSSCRVTGSEFDDEYCDRPNLPPAGFPYGGTLSGCASGQDPDNCDTDGRQNRSPPQRCDRWDAATLSTATTATKDGYCAGVTGARCRLTGNNRDREICTLNFTGSTFRSPDLRCFDVGDPYEYPPLGATASGGIPAWNTFARPAPLVALETQPPVGTPPPLLRGQDDPAVAGQVMGWDLAAFPGASNARRLCWRMVAHLGDGVVSPGEWESSAGSFRIPAGRPLITNFRSDRFLVPDPAADTGGLDTSSPALSDFTQAYAAGSIATSTVFFTKAGTTYTIANNFNNSSNDKIPQRNQWKFEGDLKFGSNVDIAHTSFLVTGNVTTTGGRLGLSAWDSWVRPQDYTANLAQKCSVEEAGVPRSSWTDWTGWKWTIKSEGSCNIDTDSFVSFGRISCRGDIVVDANADQACIVGGVSSANNGNRLPMPSACNVDGCTDNAVCLVNRVGMLGGIYSSRDLSIPNGIFASRSNQDWPDGKISQITGRGHVCVANASRVVGQITTDGASRGGVGNVWIGPDVTMMQSGEVGYGFVTKPTVWTESTW
jgi:hypothetical protein